MAQESPNRLVEWYLAIRAWLPVARRGVESWVAQVRAEPVLLWESQAVRCTLLGLGGLVVVWLVMTGVNLVALPPPADAQAPSDRAYFHVICSDSACRHHFTIYEKKSFDGFPVKCPRCGKLDGEQARQCFSKSCAGRWTVSQLRDKQPVCGSCGQPL